MGIGAYSRLRFCCVELLLTLLRRYLHFGSTVRSGWYSLRLPDFKYFASQCICTLCYYTSSIISYKVKKYVPLHHIITSSSSSRVRTEDQSKGKRHACHKLNSQRSYVHTETLLFVVKAYLQLWSFLYYIQRTLSKKTLYLTPRICVFDSEFMTHSLSFSLKKVKVHSFALPAFSAK